MRTRQLHSGTIATNLRKAMEDQGIGVRTLSTRIQDRARKANKDLRGTSPSALQLYREGKVRRPRVEVLELAAGVLGVRAEWLVLGVGEPTRAEEHARKQSDAARRAIEQQAEQDLIRHMEQALSEEIPRFGTGALAQTYNAIWELASTWITDGNFFLRHPELVKPLSAVASAVTQPLSMFPQVQVQAVREVARLLAGPADAAGINLDDLSNRHLDLYVAAASVAIQTLITDPQRLQLRKPRPQSSSHYKKD